MFCAKMTKCRDRLSVTEKGGRLLKEDESVSNKKCGGLVN